MFGRPVRPADRAEVHDPPADAGLDEGEAHGPRERRGAEEVDLEDLVPLRQRRLEHRVVVGVDAGVVHDAPEGAAEALGGVEGLTGDHRVGDVAGDGGDGARQGRRELGQRVGGAGDDDHAAAAGADGAGHVGTDAAGGAGDDDGAPVETEGVAHGWSVYREARG